MDTPLPPAPLPPGQIETGKFPVVGERSPSPIALDLTRWRLTVDGAVAHPFELDHTEFLALPHAEQTADIHCVTGWTRRAMRLGGVPLRHLLDRARPLDDARFVRFVAWSDRDHDTSLPLDVARDETWLVDHVDGAPLTPEHGFPVRTVTPSLYFYKSLKWVRRIELRVEDELGYWERESSYHNQGDPWPGDQRFTSGSLEPARVARFKEATDFTPWRRQVLLGVDLRNWTPRTRDLHALQLKNCDLRGAQLAGADLRGVNLSLTNLRGANLRGAKLADSDLEGADFSGADLSDADLRRTSLSATRFVDRSTLPEVAAIIDGADFAESSGLLEEQEAFIRDAIAGSR